MDFTEQLLLEKSHVSLPDKPYYSFASRKQIVYPSKYEEHIHFHDSMQSTC